MARAGFDHHAPPWCQLRDEIGGEFFGGDDEGGQCEDAPREPAQRRVGGVAVGGGDDFAGAYGAVWGFQMETGLAALEADERAVLDDAHACLEARGKQAVVEFARMQARVLGKENAAEIAIGGDFVAQSGAVHDVKAPCVAFAQFFDEALLALVMRLCPCQLDATGDLEAALDPFLGNQGAGPIIGGDAFAEYGLRRRFAMAADHIVKGQTRMSAKHAAIAG